MKKCTHCGKEKPLSEYSPSRKSLRGDCKSCHRSASKISVLKAKINRELAVNPEQIKAEELAAQYGKNLLWVSQGLKACRMSGVTEEYFVRRYLKRETNIVRIAAVEDAFKSLRGFLRSHDA